MYGLIALGFHITYVVSNTVNFAQGSPMMLGAVLGYTFARDLWLAAAARASPLALSLCALFGLVVERSLVRPFAARGSNAWLMATVAGGIVLDNVVLFTFGKEPRGFPSVLAHEAGRDLRRRRLSAAAPHSGGRARRSRWRCTCCFNAHAPRQGAARGGAESRRRAADGHQCAAARSPLSFAISTALAGLAGLLIAPLFSVHSDMGTLFGIKAFAVAILGGIASAWGVMLAGLLYGLIEALVTAFFGSTYTQIVAFSWSSWRSR